MSWYESAAAEIVAHLCAPESAGHEAGCTCDDCRMLILGRIENARQIIAAHDPNGWVPVTEAHPKGNVFDDVELYDPLCQRPQRMTAGMYTKSLDAGIAWALRVTHWRPIVLPEVIRGLD